MYGPTREPELAPDAAAIVGIAAQVETPAFVLSEQAVRRALIQGARVRQESGCKLLYALKPLGHVDALRWMVGHVDGMAASSLYEARLSREILGDRGSDRGIVSITSPGLRPDEVKELATYCDHIVCNSLPQYQRFYDQIGNRASLGLRVNPRLSFVEDERYDPCHAGSKLGMPLDQLAELFQNRPESLRGLQGLHFHTNCDSETFAPLLRTVRRLDRRLSPLFRQLKWVNLGGGYLLEQGRDLGPLCEAVQLLQRRYGVTVYFEPGAALVREAGYFIAQVIDLFESDDGTIAMLDTSVNHMPEVFEYQFEPDVLGHRDDGPYEYTLSGSTCLALDVFGEYGFAAPLKVGSRVIFPSAGAYTMVKAHMFNGVNLPTNYVLSADGRLHLRKRYTYQDFLSRCASSGELPRIPDQAARAVGRNIESPIDAAAFPKKPRRNRS